MLSLFFVPQLGTDSEITVTGDDAIKVTRLKIGDELMLSDGVGNWSQVGVASLSKNSFTATVLNSGSTPPSIPKLIVIQALPKSDRVKEAIELLTQGGVDEIIPWQGERSISQWKSDSADKWAKTAFAASKQSRRFQIPIIKPSLNFSTLAQSISANSLLIVFHETAEEKLSKVFSASFNKSVENIYIVIGPEGGITDTEVEKFKAVGALVAQLGQPVFRSAHAGIAALAAIQTLLRRW
jgi:16S rRNA (uracil1498-N3)-methyltransferase